MDNDVEQIRQRLQAQEEAYRQMVEGAEALLKGQLFWTERALLKLVRALYRRRVEPVGIIATEVHADDLSPSPALKESQLEAMAEAALGGHELSQWESVENGYEARCSICGMTSWLDPGGLRYSLLEDECPGEGGSGD